MFRGNVQSRIYHNAGCRYFNCKNCTMVFKSAGEAQKAGFRACRICKG
nr:Ada metal-binding domain-containing protein [uncultured Desulfovibrio sp.]